MGDLRKILKMVDNMTFYTLRRSSFHWIFACIYVSTIGGREAAGAKGYENIFLRHLSIFCPLRGLYQSHLSKTTSNKKDPEKTES